MAFGGRCGRGGSREPAFAQNGPQVAAVQVDPSRPDWENPAVNARGSPPRSATAFPYESVTWPWRATADPAAI